MIMNIGLLNFRIWVLNAITIFNHSYMGEFLPHMKLCDSPN